MPSIILPQPRNRIDPSAPSQLSSMIDIINTEREGSRRIAQSIKGVANTFLTLQAERQKLKDKTTFNNVENELDTVISSINNFTTSSPDPSTWDSFKKTQLDTFLESIDSRSKDWTPELKQALSTSITDRLVSFDAAFSAKQVGAEVKEYNLSVDNRVNREVDLGNIEEAEALIETKQITPQAMEAEKQVIRKRGVYNEIQLNIQSAETPESMELVRSQIEERFSQGRLDKGNQAKLLLDLNAKLGRTVKQYAINTNQVKKRIQAGDSYSEGEILTMVNTNQLTKDQGDRILKYQEQASTVGQLQAQYDTDKNKTTYAQFRARAIDEIFNPVAEGGEFSSKELDKFLKDLDEDNTLGAWAKMDILDNIIAARANTLLDGTEVIAKSWVPFRATERDLSPEEVNFRSTKYYSWLSNFISKASFGKDKKSIDAIGSAEDITNLFSGNEDLINLAFQKGNVDEEELLKTLKQPWLNLMIENTFKSSENVIKAGEFEIREIK